MAAIYAVMAIAVLAGPAPESEERDVLIRIGAPVRLGPADSAGAIVVIGGDAVIDGRARGHLLVIGGTARVTGSVDGSVVVVNGHADLAPGARIGGDLVLYRSTAARPSGAVIGGQTVVETGFSFGRQFLVLAWIGITVALTVAAAVFAGLGGSLLDHAATTLWRAPAVAAVGAVVTFAGLPVIAFLAFLTLVGSALGFGIVAVVLPALWILGYLVASTALGRLLLPVLRARENPERPYAAATLGLIAAQIIGLIPVVGGIAVLAAGALGAGALVSLASSRWRLAPVA